MIACKTVGEYKRKQEKKRKFCLEENAAIAKQQEAKAKLTRANPLQPAPMPQNQPGPSHSAINTQPLGHSNLVEMVKRNQQAHKRQRAAKKTLSKQTHKQVRSQAPRGAPRDPNGSKTPKHASRSPPARAYLIRKRKPRHCNNLRNQKCRPSVS